MGLQTYTVVAYDVGGDICCLKCHDGIGPDVTDVVAGEVFDEQPCCFMCGNKISRVRVVNERQ